MSRKIFCDMCGMEIESEKDIIGICDDDWFPSDSEFYWRHLSCKEVCVKCFAKRLLAHQELEAKLLHFKVAAKENNDAV